MLAHLDRKLLRDLKRLLGQAAAVALVMACGLAMMITTRSLIHSLETTRADYYESNRFNEPNLVKWEQKARKAFERLAENLPTVSKMISKPENFEQVGYISSKGILIRRMEKLMNWLEISEALAGAPASESIVFTPPPPPKKIA